MKRKYEGTDLIINDLLEREVTQDKIIVKIRIIRIIFNLFATLGLVSTETVSESCYCAVSVSLAWPSWTSLSFYFY